MNAKKSKSGKLWLKCRNKNSNSEKIEDAGNFLVQYKKSLKIAGKIRKKALENFRFNSKNEESRKIADNILKIKIPENSWGKDNIKNHGKLHLKFKGKNAGNFVRLCHQKKKRSFNPKTKKNPGKLLGKYKNEKLRKYLIKSKNKSPGK